MENTVLQIRIDKELKEKASELYDSIGLDISTAIRLFLSKSLVVRGLPFSMIKGESEFSAEIFTIKNKEDLDVFMVKENPLYENISVDEYLKESRSER